MHDNFHFSFKQCFAKLDEQLEKDAIDNPRLETTIRHLGIDLSYFSSTRILSTLKEFAGHKLLYELLVVTPNIDFSFQASPLFLFATKEVKKSIELMSQEVRTHTKHIKEHLESDDHRKGGFKITIKTYPPLPVVHGFGMRGPSGKKSTYISLCNWTKTGNNWEYQWGENKYRKIAAAPRMRDERDLLGIFDNHFNYWWENSPELIFEHEYIPKSKSS
jgi:hypothetical protein